MIGLVAAGVLEVADERQRQRRKGRLRSAAAGALGSNGGPQATWMRTAERTYRAGGLGAAGGLGIDGSTAVMALDGGGISRARERG